MRGWFLCVYFVLLRVRIQLQLKSVQKMMHTILHMVICTQGCCLSCCLMKKGRQFHCNQVQNEDVINVNGAQFSVFCPPTNSPMITSLWRRATKLEFVAVLWCPRQSAPPGQLITVGATDGGGTAPPTPSPPDTEVIGNLCRSAMKYLRSCNTHTHKRSGDMCEADTWARGGGGWKSKKGLSCVHTCQAEVKSLNYSVSVTRNGRERSRETN